MKTASENKAPERWIFPKELEGVYSDEQLKYFINEADTKLHETVSALANIRDRFYTVINILLVFIGTLSTVLFTCRNLNSASAAFLTVLLVFFLILCSIMFFQLRHYSKCGPGTKPREGLSKGAMEWMRYYHGQPSETNILYTILEFKQSCIDFNNRVCEKQLHFLWSIQVLILGSLLVIAAFLTITAIWL